MSAQSLALLLAAAGATAVGAAALHAAHGLRKEVRALRTELATRGEAETARVPAARPVPGAESRSEIRAAVAEALADERERELAEARAFWATQEARDAADAPPLLGSLSEVESLADESDDSFGPAQGSVHIPWQADFAGLEPLFGADPWSREAFDPFDALDQDDPALDTALDAPGTELPEGAETGPVEGDPATEEPAESAELAAARRRHPSHPDFKPVAAVADHERTVARLTELAESGTPLADVRPGPLGTLDVYVFADGTTVCMTPGHRATAEQLGEALRRGDSPVLLGGSGVSGAYTLTFGYGDSNVYIIADRVVASV